MIVQKILIGKWNCESDVFIYSPGIFNIRIPSRSRMNTENITRINPAMDAVSSSLPALTFSGFPPEDMMRKAEITIKRKVIPPASPNAQRKMNVSIWVVSLAGKHPIAVSRALNIPLVAQGVKILSSGLGVMDIPVGITQPEIHLSKVVKQLPPEMSGLLQGILVDSHLSDGTIAPGRIQR